MQKTKNKKNIKRLATEILEISKKEDFPHGDITNTYILKDVKNNIYTGKLITREAIVLSGIDIIEEIYFMYDESIKFNTEFKDGDLLEKESIVFEAQGPLANLLLLERSVLNTIGLMIAVATNTRQYVNKLKGTNIKIYDTRKTFPGLRELEKMAVTDGGGFNHRMSLSDAVLIKENHLKYLDINTLVERLNLIKGASFTEIEVDSLDLLNKFLNLNAKADIIMLDNFSPNDLERAIKIINNKYLIEISGGINLDNILDFNKKGVDRIAVGSLTHSVSFPDISFLID